MKRDERKRSGITRREFHGMGAVAAIVASAPWLAATASAETPESAQLATEIPDNEMLLQGLQFVSKSVKEGQQCGNCMLFQAGEDGRGKCQIVPKGVVPAEGWCLSWAAKP